MACGRCVGLMGLVGLMGGCGGGAAAGTPPGCTVGFLELKGMRVCVFFDIKGEQFFFLFVES